MKKAIIQGKAAEDYACRYLQQQGLRLVARNYRCRCGEIDLIMMQGNQLVFIEVRYRRRSDFGSAAESVDAGKQRRISKCAMVFLQNHPNLNRYAGRFDVVCITPDRSETKLDWITDAFQV